ncbi:MAG TPA: T9SS type A sorting domain-containing protein, partial [Salinimicrobium sp.]|nr:T9SS type A sorting domain-containing protein [Salinimicrobium sp.]
VPSENASTTNTLTFQFENLEPLQNREIHIEMLNFPPPTVNLGDELVFNVEITPDTDDYTPENNSVSYFQEVINSFDPNDKTVLEGSEIAIENADEYLHYMIRFQNTGTASAVNVVVTDTLNEKLNWDSMRMVSASHDYSVQITNDNFVEFIFEGIELPHEDADEEGSNGYIVYKIKPKDDVVVGDIIDGDAAIYFDFNQPIITNVASTEIVETTMSTDFFNLENSIKIYPNPSNRMVNISAGNGIEIQRIEIYSITGQKLLQQQSENDIDISNFPEGMYFMKIYSVEGNEIVKKLIKK